MITLVDTHTHLYSEEFNEDRDLAIIRAGQAGITRLIMPNVDDTTVEAMLATCEKHDGCYPLLGLHPTSVDAGWKQRLASVKAWFDTPHRFFGIGEVGMDLYWDETFRKEQMLVLDEQIQWALERDLPLSIHCRKAYPELFEVFEPYRNTSLTGVFHCFSGTEEEAARLLSYEGFMLGINGVLTFKSSPLAEVLKHIPLSRVVLETDSPYLAPVPYRGKRNESAYMMEVAERLSLVYNVPLAQIARETTGNALKVFKNMVSSF